MPVFTPLLEFTVCEKACLENPTLHKFVVKDPRILFQMARFSWIHFSHQPSHSLLHLMKFRNFLILNSNDILVCGSHLRFLTRKTVYLAFTLSFRHTCTIFFFSRIQELLFSSILPLFFYLSLYCLHFILYSKVVICLIVK